MICKGNDPRLADFIYDAITLDKFVDIKIHREIRTSKQNAARWKYLELIAEELTERGETFNPQGMKIEVPFTKDNLYSIYWQSLRNNMFPDKKKQLNTKEFSELVDMAQMMFAKIFSINIPFPNWEDLAK